MEVFLKFLTSEPEQRKSVFFEIFDRPHSTQRRAGPSLPPSTLRELDGMVTAIDTPWGMATGWATSAHSDEQRAIGYAMAIGIINWWCDGMGLYLRHH